MNRDNYKKHRALIEQWSKGDDVEYLTSAGIWKQIRDPAWCGHLQYRIKPKPLEVWILLDREGRVCHDVFLSRDEAERVASTNTYYKYPHLMREVC